MQQVVEADIYCDEHSRGVVFEERVGEAELRDRPVTLVSAAEHGQCCLAGTAQLHETEAVAVDSAL